MQEGWSMTAKLAVGVPSHWIRPGSLDNARRAELDRSVIGFTSFVKSDARIGRRAVRLRSAVK